jgi:hypothetical protein
LWHCPFNILVKCPILPESGGIFFIRFINIVITSYFFPENFTHCNKCRKITLLWNLICISPGGKTKEISHLLRPFLPSSFLHSTIAVRCFYCTVLQQVLYWQLATNYVNVMGDLEWFKNPFTCQFHFKIEKDRSVNIIGEKAIILYPLKVNALARKT